jgi:hypothetical protein
VDEAEKKLFEVLKDTLVKYPDWLKIARRQMEETL